MKEVPSLNGQIMMKIRNACVELSRRHSHSVGFIPRDVYIHAYVESRLKCHYDGETLLGFALHSPLNAIVTIHQECVLREVMRTQIGTEMYLRIYQECLEKNVERIRLHCATELESNFFWEQMGLRCVALREPGSLTARPANRWEIVFPAGEQLEAQVAEVMAAPKVAAMAKFLGIEESLRKGLDRRFRKKLFPGSRLRRAPRKESD